MAGVLKSLKTLFFGSDDSEEEECNSDNEWIKDSNQKTIKQVRWQKKKSKLGYRLSINCTHSTYILSRQAAVPSTTYKAKCLFINLFSSLKQRRVQAEVAQKFNEKSTYIIHCVLPSNNICTQHWFSKLL